MIDITLPLTDIHRHLDGNIRAQTILDLGRQFNIALPAQTLETLIPHVQVTSTEPDLVSFLTKLDWGVKVLASLDACRRVAFENIEDAARNGLHYVELRFSPGYMAMAHQLPIAGVVEAVIDGVRDGCNTFGVEARLIGIMSRTFGEAACLQELDALLAHREKITALDLAGDELGFPGSLFLSHFNRARDAGWHITVHAGEAAGPESIWQAIRELGAERIGHGVKAVEDRALMDFLAQQRIGIESCLTSNIQTSTVASLADHPLKTFLEHGVLASLNTDDPAVQGVDIIHEYHVAAPAAGLSREQIRQAQINGLEIAFLSDDENVRCAKKWPRRKIALLMLTSSLRLRFNAITGGEMRHLRQDTASRDVLPIPCPVQSTP
ncbi:adenosine deaminase [Salmonella enterica subsp. enterica serovar Montevideo str. CT_02035278]|nr:adenosine deaminase [Salmonella enterica subsp. enterica serovar Montevideo str. CT_02035278]